MSFKYIDPDNVGYTAGDATELTELAFGKQLPGQEEIAKLRLGNTGGSDATFTVTGTSTNTSILDGFTISDDGETYVAMTTGITISNLKPNAISDVIYVKFTVPDDAYISNGTIRLDVAES